MSIIKTNTAHRGASDHFEPEHALDPADQRRLRGHMEQIDYTAYAANQAVLGQANGRLDLGAFQRLAVAAAQARAQWMKAALAIGDSGHGPTRQEVETLSERRAAFEELREAYEGMRRMVERGYLAYRPNA